jgi:hypothetical protein
MFYPENERDIFIRNQLATSLNSDLEGYTNFQKFRSHSIFWALK